MVHFMVCHDRHLLDYGGDVHSCLETYAKKSSGFILTVSKLA